MSGGIGERELPRDDDSYHGAVAGRGIRGLDGDQGVEAREAARAGVASPGSLPSTRRHVGPARLENEAFIAVAPSARWRAGAGRPSRRPHLKPVGGTPSRSGRDGGRCLPSILDPAALNASTSSAPSGHRERASERHQRVDPGRRIGQVGEGREPGGEIGRQRRIGDEIGRTGPTPVGDDAIPQTRDEAGAFDGSNGPGLFEIAAPENVPRRPRGRCGQRAPRPRGEPTPVQKSHCEPAVDDTPACAV